MKTITKFLSIFSVIALLALTFATPALAFDGRSGETVVIGADEVIEDDLYVSAADFTLEGTVKGDLIVVGANITINGTVDGDLIAAGQSVTINGTVTDDARIAGAALQLGKDAVVGGDVVAAGASLEAKSGSSIDGELALASGQGLLEGKIAGDVLVGAGSLELSGEFGGDVNAQVGDPEAGGPPPSMYMSQSGVRFPTVQPGFTINDGAKIKGNLEYTQTQKIEIPEGSVTGKVLQSQPVVDPTQTPAKPTPAQAALKWSLDLVRSIVTLIIFGLLLGWLVPSFIKSLMDKVQSQPAATLGWGLFSYAAFFFALLVIVIAMILGGMFFGVLTLGGVSGTIIWVGLLSIFALIVGFVLVASFLTKVTVAWLGGKLILGRLNPGMADHKVWPLVIGAIIIALLAALPFIGWLFALLVELAGLGALWLWGRDLTQKPQAA